MNLPPNGFEAMAVLNGFEWGMKDENTINEPKYQSIHEPKYQSTREAT